MPGGAAPTPPAIGVMASVGLDISGHCSVQVTPAMAEEADLIVTMTRQHVVEVTVMAPAAWPHLFQVRDLLRRAEPVGPRPPDTPLSQWLAVVGEGRTRPDVLAASLSDDVADPVGQSHAVYERTLRDLDDLLSRLARLL
jgi:protein-tyrosine phosphatase